MENENFAASKPNEPLMSHNHQAQHPHQHQHQTPVVAVVDEDESKKKFLPQIDGDGVHYKKDFGQVEIKQTPKFIGLTQEELQRYADDPFWRKLRMALFILFWLSWILMFVIAIILVVTSPKCPAKPQRQWWHKQLCYQTYTRTFKDSDGDGVGDFNGMKEKIYDTNRLNVQTIWPVPVLESKNFTGYDVTDFKAVDSRLGTLPEFEALIKAAHEHKMFVVIDLPLTTMSSESEWFKQSSSRSTGAYANWFYWNSAPSVDGGNKWLHNDVRTESYLTLKDTKWPILNWGSGEFRKEMNNVLRFWLDKGIDGFYIGNVHLMGLKNDFTTDWETVAERLRELRSAVDSFKNDTGNNKEIALFTSLTSAAGGDDPLAIKTLLTGGDGLNYVLHTELTDVNDTCDAVCIRNHLVKIHDYHKMRRANETSLNQTNSDDDSGEAWPVWEIGSPYKSRVASRLGNNREKAELLQMLLFMLEGSINTYYGDELGLLDAPVKEINLDQADSFKSRSPMQWNDGANAGFSTSTSLPIPVNKDYATNNLKTLLDSPASSAKLYRKMSEWRMNDEAFLYGKMEVGPRHESLVAVQRKAYSSSPNYYAVMNFANDTITVNLKTELNFTLPSSSSEPTVGLMTTNLANANTYKTRDPIDVTKVSLKPFSGLVIKYK